ncbi:MAG: alanine--tRNA ligase [Candidatus Jordarchaeum sp.]|uniref:alanine--tRNA ligase n=1 Tax=Candidatus Jordarchaeum sp. TaxID=2823881 RepID=UPI00404B5014
MISKEELRKKFGRESYYVELFQREGFERRRCRSCNDWYWTTSDSELCGDTKCVGGYKFIGRSVDGGWDFHEAVRNWSDFFEKRSHTRIGEYPVVARWRDDIPFTIASITDFQPYVVEGVIEPPANPLVVPQPCIRFGGKGFNDIDNVGKTGRHLSLFVMGGQHAFNYDGKGYWMDRCIELNFEFLTKCLKLKRDEVSYKEDVWTGGGNFGPCLESFGRGLEIVNNVFMQYAFTPSGAYRELDIKVIDVGWGVERVGWFTQGSPTIYEATFGPVLDWLKGSTGVSVDEELLGRYTVLSGLLNVDEVDNIDEARKEVATKLDIDQDDLDKSLGPLEALYAISDHTRTLVFAIADGGIPSNVGGGYNLRIILRRVLSLNDLYSFDLDFLELLHKHIDYLKKTYRRVDAASDIINDIFNIERERYYQTLEKGKKYVAGLIKKQKELDLSTLIELYESKGISPEMAQEIADESGIKLEIPGDFYVQLGSKKERVTVAPTMDTLLDSLKDLPPTRTLYYEKPYEKEFEATVLKVVDSSVVLDQTLFYPTGGGAANDTGNLNGYKVIDVEKLGNVIVHKLDKPVELKSLQRVKGRIDWDRRIALMRHHTSTHVVNGAAKSVLGSHIWQAGAEKTPESARLDITHYKALSTEEIRKIERIANEIVMENRLVRVKWMRRDEAEKQYGFQIYQGGAVPGSNIRIIDIENWDVEACGGTHLKSTGEIGLIKIKGAERIQDGVVRLEFSAGIPAIEYDQKIDELLEKTASVFRVPNNQLPKTAERFFEEWKRRGKEIEKLRSEIAEIEAREIMNKMKKFEEYELIVEKTKLGIDEAIKIASKITDERPNAVVVLAKTNDKVDIIGMIGESVNIDINGIIREASKIVNGSGGGKGRLARGGGPKVEKTGEMLNNIEDLIKRYKK